MLTRDELFAAAARQPIPFRIDEQRTVHLAPLSVDAVDHVELCVERPELRSGITAYIVSRGLVDAAGNRLFEDSDAQKIGAAPSPLFARLAKEILRLSRVAEEDIGKLEKNLPPTRSGSGG